MFGCIHWLPQPLCNTLAGIMGFLAVCVAFQASKFGYQGIVACGAWDSGVQGSGIKTFLVMRRDRV